MRKSVEITNQRELGKDDLCFCIFFVPSAVSGNKVRNATNAVKHEPGSCVKCGWKRIRRE